jgi:spermidine/putrescine transport system permease protein
VLVAFSFNQGRLTASWEGFTFDWYLKLLHNEPVLTAVRNSLIVGAAATVLATVLGTTAALALHRHRFRRQGGLDALFTLPIVVPEIVLASSLLLLFAAIGLELGFVSIVLAHVAFSVSYAVVVVRARLSGFDRSLEEAAMDLGARPWRTFWQVTLPQIFPGVMAAALLVFALSIDDYVITSFVAGVGTTTLPVQIYSMLRRGITPEINAVSTLLLLATSLLLFAAHRLEQGARARTALLPALLGLCILATPFALGRSASEGERVLNLYLWSNYIAPETVKKFEVLHGVRVNLDVYDTNEALLSKVQAGNVPYDVLCPSNYVVEILARKGCVAELDHAPAEPPAPRPALPRPRLRPRQPALDPLLLGLGRHRVPPERRGDGRLLGRPLGRALQGPRADARRPPRDPGRGPQVEGPEPERRKPRRASRGPGPAGAPEAAGEGLRLGELPRRAALG